MEWKILPPMEAPEEQAESPPDTPESEPDVAEASDPPPGKTLKDAPFSKQPGGSKTPWDFGSPEP